MKSYLKYSHTPLSLEIIFHYLYILFFIYRILIVNLKQLRLMSEMVKTGYSVTKTAEQLFTTQPSISTQLKALENELDITLFQRHGKRIINLTPAGKVVHQYAEQALSNIHAIHQVADDFSKKETGTLSISTTHTQARYALPKVIKRFSKRYPQIQLRIHQGNPTQITDMVIRGESDFAIATEGIAENKHLKMLPVYQWNRCVIATPDHPINKIKKLKLEDIANYPIVTYDFAFAGRSAINDAFKAKQLTPNIVLTALDADVIKTYVSLGLGIGLLASMAYNKKTDTNLVKKEAGHLFNDSTTYLGFKKGQYLKNYMLEFIQWFAPNISREEILLLNDQDII